MNEQKPSSLLRTLASALWFPIFFIVGFMLCYLLPFHAPSPHDMPLVAVGDQPAQQIDAAFDKAIPGGADVTSVPDEQAARSAVTDRDAVAAYDPGTGNLFYAKANGSALMQFVQQMFSPIASASGHHLTPIDLAPTATGDVMGTGLFYCLLAMNIPPYVTVMMLLRAALSTRQKIFSLMGVGAFASVVVYCTALALQVVPNNPLMLVVGFLLTQAVGWTAFGLAPIVKQFIPGVAMTLFVLLSMPSSSGAIPKELVHPFFQALHPILPLGQTVDAMRGLLYFNGSGVFPGVAGLLCWWAFGAALVVFNQWREKRKLTEDPAAIATAGSYEYEDDSDAVVDPSIEPPQPTVHRILSGSVVDTGDAPIPGAVVTVTDTSGMQLARIVTTREGAYEVHGLPDQFVTVVVSASGMKPAVDRTAVETGRTTGYNFALEAEGAHAGNRHAAAARR